MKQKPGFGEPYDMAELRRALDDDREERAAKRKAAEETERKQEQETLQLTAPLPLALKAKAHAAKEAEPVYCSEIIVGPICHCRSFRYPHFLDAHEQLESQWDWRTPEERERDEEAAKRESKRSLPAGDTGSRQPADRVRSEADRRPGKVGGQTG